MQATALSVTLSGLEAHLVRVEVDSGRGHPMFRIVGLPEVCVRERRGPVAAALRCLDVELNEYVITNNQAPAYLRKGGSASDVAIALGILAALERIPAEPLARTVLLGELSLSGDVRAVRGVLPALLGARRRGISEAVVPLGNGPEAAAIAGIRARTAENLEQIVAHFTNASGAELPVAVGKPKPSRPGLSVDFAEVRGQYAARRVLEIAAAGEHNLLMMGPPGAGKTMLARRVPTILPPMTDEESLTVTAVHSVAGLLAAKEGLLTERPFRAPHHTLSSAALFGGGDPLRPGEISLAHHGCLFLDELLEFRRHVLEGMRQPLETGEVNICRARMRVTFPARPLLVAAVNPCPCGYYASAQRPCTCSPKRVQRYRSRLSGPLLDRIDLHVALPALTIDELQRSRPGESSAVIRARVTAARAIQFARFERGLTSTPYNATLRGVDLDKVAAPNKRACKLLANAVKQLGLSTRGYIKVRRVARTIADLEGKEHVGSDHYVEALGARALDRRAGQSLAKAS